MTALTRRHLLGGVAATGAIALTQHSPAHAAAPVKGQQAPGLYR